MGRQQCPLLHLLLLYGDCYWTDWDNEMIILSGKDAKDWEEVEQLGCC